MTYKEELKKLNSVVADIKENVGDKCFLGMFMGCCNQLHIRLSRIEVDDEVYFERSEVINGDIEKLYVERASLALHRMRDNIDETIKILQKGI